MIFRQLNQLNGPTVFRSVLRASFSLAALDGVMSRFSVLPKDGGWGLLDREHFTHFVAGEFPTPWAAMTAAAALVAQEEGQ